LFEHRTFGYNQQTQSVFSIRIHGAIMTRTLTCCLLVFGAGFIFSEDEPKQTITPTLEPLFEARFLDGSLVMLSTRETTIVVNTKYGKLTVPLNEIKKIDLGFRYPAGVEAGVKAAMEDLASSDYKIREEGQKRLIAFGEYAVAPVKAGIGSSTPEVAERCSQIMKKLTETLPSEKLEPRELDVVVTEELTIRGAIGTKSILAKNKYFGEATVSQFSLDASKYAQPNWAAWYDTGLEVSKDLAIEISVTGQINLAPPNVPGVPCGPNGLSAAAVPPGAIPPGGQVPGGQPRAASSMGAVYGRIGPNGEMFKIGANYKQSGAPASGKLYLIIGQSRFSTECSGEYKVTVKSGR
jgi:hypothetical protein